MSINRSTIVQGPAIVKFDGAVLYTPGDVNVDVGLETFPIMSSIHGRITRRVKQRLVSVSLTAIGEWKDQAKIWPHVNAAVGTRFYGSTDKPLQIHSKAGRLLEFACAGISKQPPLNLSSVKTIHGPMEFLCSGGNNESWSAADNLWTDTASAFADTSINRDSILTQPYAVAWGDTSPFDAIKTKEGVIIDPSTEWDPIETDDDGIVEYELKDVDIVTKLIPLGISVSQLLTALALQGSGNERGRDLGDSAHDLVITGAGVAITQYQASMQKAPLRYGLAVPRAGEIEFVSTRTLVDGVLSDLLLLATE